MKLLKSGSRPKSWREWWKAREQVMEAEVVWPAPARHVKAHCTRHKVQRTRCTTLAHCTRHTAHCTKPKVLGTLHQAQGTRHLGHYTVTLHQAQRHTVHTLGRLGRHTALQLEDIKATCSNVKTNTHTQIFRLLIHNSTTIRQYVRDQAYLIKSFIGYLIKSFTQF